MNQPCSLCGAETTTIHHPKMGEYHHCTQCEFISKDERFIPSKEEELHEYNLHINTIDDSRYVDFFYKFLNDAVFPYANEGKEGFDFGSGPSPVLAQILEQNHDYQMDVYDLYYTSEKVYEGKKYDVITATEVVEHVKNPLETFQLFASLMKPDSILAVMTLFHYNDEERFLKWHYARDKTHISFYSLKTMEYIASKAGLKVIHSNNIRYTTFTLDEK